MILKILRGGGIGDRPCKPGSSLGIRLGLEAANGFGEEGDGEIRENAGAIALFILALLIELEGKDPFTQHINHPIFRDAEAFVEVLLLIQIGCQSRVGDFANQIGDTP